jgi:hypothetical protein
MNKSLSLSIRAAAALVAILVTPACLTLFGDYTVVEPVVGSFCESSSDCGDGRECSSSLGLTEYDAKDSYCTVTCDTSTPCPEGFACAFDTKFSTAKHCRPAATVQTYAEGDYCDDAYRDPCPSPLTCAEKPSSRSVGGDVSHYCLQRCNGSNDQTTCASGKYCEQGRDGFFCE